MNKHFWTQIVMVPVEVTLTAEGNLDIHTTEAAEEIGQEDARIGCWFCSAPLRKEALDAPCRGQEAASQGSGAGHPDSSELDPSGS